MTNATIELPSVLIEQAQTRGISLPQLERVVVHLVQAYLQEYETIADTADNSRVDGREFAQRIISSNRQLFEELAQHR